MMHKTAATHTIQAALDWSPLFVQVLSFFLKWKHGKGIQLHFSFVLFKIDLKQSHKSSKVGNQHKAMHNTDG